MPPSDCLTIPSFLEGLTPEMGALLSIYLMYWRVEERIEAIELTPALAKGERHLIISLFRPRRMGELAKEMQALPSTVTALADSLEDKGLLERRHDPDDRRAWLLCLTDAGMALRQSLSEQASQIFRDIVGLDDADRAKLTALLGEVGETIFRTGLPKGLKP